MTRVLVVDDEAGVRFAVGELLEDAGYDVVSAASVAEARPQLERADVVVTDLVMPGGSGLELLAEARGLPSPPPVILLTARGSERSAVEALKGGAWDYLTKPFDAEVLRAAVARAGEVSGLRRGSRDLLAERALGHTLVAESAPMRALLDMVARLARRDVTVLLRGATGVGKEVVATLLHAFSGRAQGPLVRFNCAAIPQELAEAELFGHGRGAFTGAVAASPGYFARADGGTLVLDEVGELPPGVQAKLLRALQGGEIQPVGAGAPRKVDVRVIASTHRDLGAMAREGGGFREDLYYRLAVVELVVPPLSERPEDVAPLALAAAERHARRFGMETPRLTPELLAALEARPWPGNVRELDNTMARLVALSDPGATLGLEALAGRDAAGAEAAGGGLRAEVDAFERALLERTLRGCGGNQSEAARRLRLSRSTLIEKLKRFGIIGDGAGK